MPVIHRKEPATESRSSACVSLLGGFDLRVAGAPVALPIQACRVLAYLALDCKNRPNSARNQLAERLWSDVSTDRAYASLRTALWRIRQCHPQLIQVERDRLRLHDLVDVDVNHSRGQALRLLSDDPDLRPADAQVAALIAELLPDWDEHWLVMERERLRQLQLHALEALARRLCTLRRYPEAIDVAFLVIAAEPLRESAHRALIDVYLAEGNAAQAHRQFDRYATMLHAELGLTPTESLIARVGGRSYGDPRPGYLPHRRPAIPLPPRAPTTPAFEWDASPPDRVTRRATLFVPESPHGFVSRTEHL
ncbi:BTAD domain-containing putative transcriptional regulator [Micromonospora sp. NPDC007230]|uniref:AfsR/SARP family transcriptional regulator n=1 Tax=Micromonospora sp. NPDC007230 TaxID=3364237 RepID=UPI0036962E14